MVRHCTRIVIYVAHGPDENEQPGSLTYACAGHTILSLCYAKLDGLQRKAHDEITKADLKVSVRLLRWPSQPPSLVSTSPTPASLPKATHRLKLCHVPMCRRNTEQLQ